MSASFAPLRNLDVLVANTAAQGSRNTGYECANEHRESQVDRSLGRSFPGDVGVCFQFDLRLVHGSDEPVDSRLSISLRHPSAGGNLLGQVCAICIWNCTR